MAPTRRRSRGRNFTLLLKTKEFRIVRWKLRPGESTPRTMHRSSYVVMPRTNGDMERIIVSGKRRIVKRQKLTAGKPYLRRVSGKGLEQEFRNVGRTIVIFEKVSGP